MEAEMNELKRCFNKSEMVRKQQKILIEKMREQIEALKDENEHLKIVASKAVTKAKKLTEKNQMATKK